MAAIAIRKNAFNNASPGQRNVLRLVLEKLDLGDPATYKNPSGTEFFVFNDNRISLKDVQWVGWIVTVLANVANVDAVNWRSVPLTELQDVTVPVRIQVEVPITDENGDPTGETVLVWQDHPTETQVVQREVSLGDPYSLVLSANYSGNVVAAAEAVPASWTPVSGVE